MLLGNDGLFDGIHAADTRTIRVIAVVDIPGAHALEPCNLLWLFMIRWPYQVPFKGSGGGEDSFKLHAGNYIWMTGIVIGVIAGRIKGLKAGRQEDRAHLDGMFHRTHIMIYGFCQTSLHALVAFRAYPAREAPLGLCYCLFLAEPQLNLVETVKPLLRFEPWHLRPGDRIMASCIYILNGCPFMLPVLFKVFTHDEAINGDGGLFPGFYGLYHCSWAGYRITPGKDILIIGLESQGIHIHGAPIGKCAGALRTQTGPIRLLAYGRDDRVNFYYELRTLNRYGATSAAIIRLAQGHFDTFD